jgi:hypothetical protein
MTGSGTRRSANTPGRGPCTDRVDVHSRPIVVTTIRRQASAGRTKNPTSTWNARPGSTRRWARRTRAGPRSPTGPAAPHRSARNTTRRHRDDHQRGRRDRDPVRLVAQPRPIRAVIANPANRQDRDERISGPTHSRPAACEPRSLLAHGVVLVTSGVRGSGRWR